VRSAAFVLAPHWEGPGLGIRRHNQPNNSIHIYKRRVMDILRSFRSMVGRESYEPSTAVMVERGFISKQKTSFLTFFSSVSNHH
jgi:hypothetical protein